MYLLRALTAVASIDSPPISASSPDAVPGGVSTLDPTVITARSVLVEWTVPAQPNGQSLQYYVYGSHRDRTGRVVEEKWEGSSSLSANLTGLRSFTLYTLTLEACTSAGCANGSSTHAKTEPSLPELFDDPIVDDSFGADRLHVSWAPAREPNGEVSHYELYASPDADDAMMYLKYRGMDTSFTITRLTPETSYRVKVRVFNKDVDGFTETSVVTARTPMSAPEDLIEPYAVVLTSTSVLVTVSAPGRPNGEIDYYGIIFNGALRTNVTEPGNYTVSKLIPYTAYDVSIRVCIKPTETSAGGCSTSDTVTVRTLADVPEGLDAPQVVNLNATVVLVRWTSPHRPHGPLIEYHVYRNDDRITTVPPAEPLGFVDSTTSPYTLYNYSIEAVGAAGTVRSPDSRILTLPAAPEGAVPPEVEVTGSRSVDVTILPPIGLHGPLFGYLLYLRGGAHGTGEGRTVYSGVDTDVTIDDEELLEPFISYELRSVVINSVGRAQSAWTPFRMNEAAPAAFASGSVVILELGSSWAHVAWNHTTSKHGLLTAAHVVAEDLSGVAINLSSTVPLDANSMNISGLSPLTMYDISVHLCTRGGCVASPAVTATTMGSPPGGFSISTLVALDESTVEIRWDEPEVDAQGVSRYDIVRNGEKIASVSTRTYIDDTVMPSSAYVYMIVAVNPSGEITRAPNHSWRVISANDGLTRAVARTHDQYAP